MVSSEREKHLLLGGTWIYIHQWHVFLVEATLEKSGIIPFIIFSACLCGSKEIMDFSFKNKDLIDCIFFFQRIVDSNLFKNNGKFSFSFRVA